MKPLIDYYWQRFRIALKFLLNDDWMVMSKLGNLNLKAWAGTYVLLYTHQRTTVDTKSVARQNNVIISGKKQQQQ